MILAARYDVTGPLSGIPIVCRQISGPQRWLIKFDLLTADGMREERDVTCDEAIPLAMLGPFAQECIADLFTGKDLLIKSASWKAYVLSNKGQRNKPKRRKR